MGEFQFGSYRGRLSAKIVKQIERKFAHEPVYVVNYTEPRGEQRGWFAGPNRGHPFDQALALEVLEYARSVARGKDALRLAGKSEGDHGKEEG